MPITVLHACDYNDTDRTQGFFFSVKEKDIFLTKRIRVNGTKKGANYPKRFRLGHTHTPATLEELCPLLESLSADPKALVVRCVFPNFSLDDKIQRRAKYAQEVPSTIIAIDIDELELPEGMSSTDLISQGSYACNLLHECAPHIFPEDMGFIAQGSSSAGLGTKIKLHLWLANRSSLTQPQLRNLFHYINTSYKRTFNSSNTLVDTALYHDVQAHYTAYPIWDNPSMDPFKTIERTVMHKGALATVPSSYNPYVKPIHVSEKERNHYLNSVNASFVKSAEVQKKLDKVLNWDGEVGGLRNSVVAALHSIVQDQYDIDYATKEIGHIIRSLRPDEDYQDYINQGVVSAINNVKACSIRTLPKECKGLEMSTIESGTKEKYLDVKNFPKDTVTFLKASLGTGKTHTIAQMLKTGQISGKVLTITDTSALVESNAKRFNAGDFRSEKSRLDFVSGKIDRLSGTLHSLHKIKNLTTKFDFLFIDEADSLLDNLLFASIIEEDTKSVLMEVLAELLQFTDRVVVSDGDLSEETVKCYIDLMQGTRNLCRVNHKRKNLTGVTAYKHLTEASLWGALQGDLELGEKCLLVSDCSPAHLNEYLVAFNRLMPAKNIKVVHSCSKIDPEVKDIIDNTTTSLRKQKIDALLCSPSITNGVDFNYFSTVFVITSSRNHTPNMRFQAMMREREPETVHYYFSSIKGYQTGFTDNDVDTGITSSARRVMATRKEKEFKTYIATFNYYLIDSGATVEVIDDPYDNPIEAADKALYHDERVCAVLNATPNYIQARHNDALEVQNRIKFYYDIEDELTYDDVDLFLKERPDLKAEMLHKLFVDFWYILKKCDETALKKELRRNGYKYYLAIGESIKPAKQVLVGCGLKNGPEEALQWYKKYCEFTSGVELPDELKDTLEESRDL